MTELRLPRHGRNHLPGGSDPIPGLSAILEPPGNFSDWVLALTGTWAYWPLQDASGNAVDLGPTGADLAPIGTPAYHVIGPNSTDLPYAVRLTGVRANSIADDSFFDSSDVLNAGADDEFTAICWVKPDSGSTLTSNLPIIGTWDVFRTGWILYLINSTRQLTFVSGNGTSTSSLLGPAVTDDVWTQVAVTRSAAGAVHLYVNGSDVASNTGLTNYLDNSHGIRLGAADFDTTDPDSYFFYGNMAGAVWVDHVLTGGEILDGYNLAIAAVPGAVPGSILWEDV